MEIIKIVLSSTVGLMGMVGIFLSSISIRLTFIVPALLFILKVIGETNIPWIAFGWSVFTSPFVMLGVGIVGLMLSGLATIVSATYLKGL